MFMLTYDLWFELVVTTVYTPFHRLVYSKPPAHNALLVFTQECFVDPQ